MTNSTSGLPLHAEPPPLRADEGGAVRVGKNRVSLDLVVEQYENGMTPEDLVRAYDTLVLADVHAVIAYYLRHRDEVRAYLTRRAVEAESLRTKIEAERPRVSREELFARRSAGEKAEHQSAKRGSKQAVLKHFGVFQDDSDVEEQRAAIRAGRKAEEE